MIFSGNHIITNDHNLIDMSGNVIKRSIQDISLSYGGFKIFLTDGGDILNEKFEIVDHGYARVFSGSNYPMGSRFNGEICIYNRYLNKMIPVTIFGNVKPSEIRQLINLGNIW